MRTNRLEFMNLNETKGVDFLLWAVLAFCLIFVTLWIVGVRFFGHSETVVPITIEQIDDAESDDEVQPIQELPQSDDQPLPISEQNDNINDGRDPNAPLL